MLEFKHQSDTNIGLIRKANEDCHNHAKLVNLKDAYAYVVCDGMGGHVGGATASSMAVKCIIDHLQKATLQDPQEDIREAFNFANTQVYATAMSDPTLHGMGTTGVVLIIKGAFCYFGHVGDSRLYLFSDKQLYRLTKDQSFVQQLVDSGAITDDEAEHHPKKNQILQAIGIAPEIIPVNAVSPLSVKKGDRILLCTDGLNGMINDRVIAATIRGNNDITYCAKQLIQAALENGGRDNVTVTLIEILNSPHTHSKFTSYNPQPQALGTEVFQTPLKYSTLMEKYRKYRVHIYAAGGALVAALSILVLYPMITNKVLPPTTVKQVPPTDYPKKTVTISKLENEDPIKLEEYKGYKVSDCNKDTTLISKLAPNSNIIIQEGIVKGIEKKEVLQNNNNITRNKKSQQNKGNNKASGDKTHTIKSGETVIVIAKKYKTNGCNVTSESILEDNNIPDETQLKPGRKLIIKCH